jgi:signal transduction histidine kinase/CheY-like chemotaxis protein
VASAPIALFAINERGVITFAEGRGPGLIAPMPSDLVGQSMTALYRGATLETGDDVETTFGEMFAKALDGVTTRAHGKLGDSRFDLHLLPQHGVDGSVVGVIGVSSDRQDRTPSEREQLTAQLAHADRMAALGALAAGVSHEINNPLTSMLLNVEVALRRVRAAGVSSDPWATLGGGDGLATMVEALVQAVDAAGKVRDIVRSLTTFSRGDVEQRGLVDVHGVVEAAIQTTFCDIRRRAKLVRAMREVPPVEANEARLSQVFVNLLLNATNAIPDGAPADHEVRVSTFSADGDKVVVEVCDTGSGIPADVLPRIFDPFFTTKVVARATGLGLSISYGTVKSLGGELTVESAVGHGTTFRVTLPAARGWLARSRAPATGPLLVKKRILVVEEDRHVAQALVRALADEQDVETVASGAEALERLSAGARYDVILCDMPGTGTSGIDFYGDVLRVAPEVVGDIVFMSGGGCSAQALAFVESIGHRCLDKPVDLVKLRDLLRRRGRERLS